MSTGRPPKFSAGSSPQQASRFSGLRGRASQQPSVSSSRQGSGQLRQPYDDRTASGSRQGSGLLESTLSSQRFQSQSLSGSMLRPQSSQPLLLRPQSSQPEWQSNIAYSPQSSVTSQQSNTALTFPLRPLSQQGSTPLMQQASTQGIRFTSTPRLGTNQSVESGAVTEPGAMANEGSLQQPQANLQPLEGSQQQLAAGSSAQAEIIYTSQPTLQVRLPQSDGALESSHAQPPDFATQGYLPHPQGDAAQPSSSSTPLAQHSSAASQQAEALSSTPQGGLIRQMQQGRLQEPRTMSDMQREGWFQNDVYDDGQDPNLHNPRCGQTPEQNCTALPCTVAVSIARDEGLKPECVASPTLFNPEGYGQGPGAESCMLQVSRLEDAAFAACQLTLFIRAGTACMPCAMRAWQPPKHLCLFCRDVDIDRRNSGALASPSTPLSSPGAGPFNLERMSLQANAELQAQEEERNQLRIERMHRANRAAAAARAAIKVGRSLSGGREGWEC